MRRRLALTIAVAAVLASGEASGEPIYHLKSPSTVTTEKGSTLSLPPGYFLDEDTWKLRDEELKRLQERETRLEAENKALRSWADEVPWKTIACAMGFGLGIGLIVHEMK